MIVRESCLLSGKIWKIFRDFLLKKVKLTFSKENSLPNGHITYIKPYSLRK